LIIWNPCLSRIRKSKSCNCIQHKISFGKVQITIIIILTNPIVALILQQKGDKTRITVKTSVNKICVSKRRSYNLKDIWTLADVISIWCSRYNFMAVQATHQNWNCGHFGVNKFTNIDYRFRYLWYSRDISAPLLDVEYDVQCHNTSQKQETVHHCGFRWFYVTIVRVVTQGNGSQT
jgi:hypothetical protein